MRKALVLFCLFLSVAGVIDAQLSDGQIVANAFPTSLDQGDGLRYSNFIVADLNRNGQPVIIAAYTNRVEGAIRVLNRAGQVLAAPNVGMRGFAATLKAIDLDGDGIPEVLAEFDMGRSQYNPDTWVFRWTGSGLQLISPTCSLGSLTLTCLGYVSFVDMNGDGKLSLLSWPSTKLNGGTGQIVSSGVWKLYTLNNGVFQDSGARYLFAREFHRGNGAPFTSQRSFPAAPGPATLRVVNGAGAEASTSGHIILNGAEVLGPADFKRNQHVYDLTVTLAAQNSLTVRLDGKPGSKINVLISLSSAAKAGAASKGSR